MERIQAFPVGHIDFKLRKMYIEVLQGGLYELRTPRKKLKSLPQSALDEIDSYVDYIFFKFASEESSKSVSQKKGFGCLKDIPCKMAPDFDEPLEEFAEYM